jgi:hypothetical protein
MCYSGYKNTNYLIKGKRRKQGQSKEASLSHSFVPSVTVLASQGLSNKECHDDPEKPSCKIVEIRPKSCKPVQNHAKPWGIVENRVTCA